MLLRSSHRSVIKTSQHINVIVQEVQPFLSLGFHFLSFSFMEETASAFLQYFITHHAPGPDGGAVLSVALKARVGSSL